MITQCTSASERCYTLRLIEISGQLATNTLEWLDRRPNDARREAQARMWYSELGNRAAALAAAQDPRP